MSLESFLAQAARSPFFLSILWAYLIAHTIKFFLYHYRFRKWSILPFFETGGMPSSHTAVTVALTISVGLETGPSAVFFVCALFSAIIIRDSFGVRKSVSDQAHILNALASEMKVHKKAKIVLGHTPLQVLAGFLVGVLVPLALYYL